MNFIVFPLPINGNRPQNRRDPQKCGASSLFYNVLLPANHTIASSLSCFFKPHPHLYANAKMHAKRIMSTCKRTAFTFIRLCGVCSANRRTLSVWSRYFKEKYVRNYTDVDVHSFRQPMNNQRNACSFACAANAEQATFWHLLAFAFIPHALFAFAYRFGHAFTPAFVTSHQL